MRQLKCEMFPITLILVTEEKEMKALFVKNQAAHDLEFPPSGEAMTIDFGSVVVVVLGATYDALEKGWASEVDSILVHEAVHVAQYLFRYIDEKSLGVETEAYAIQYFAAYLMKEWRYRENRRIAEVKKNEQA